MEGNGGEHNLERAIAALERAGARLECPSCGNRDWFRNPDPVVLKETRRVEVDDVGVPVGGELFGGIAAYALICSRCGFMRLHSTHVLLGGAT
jgi:hypothetical protein